MDTLLASLDKKKKLLSELEKQVLDFLIIYPDIVTDLTINELSERLFVSTATITRTSQKIGFSGYQELKYVLSKHHETSFIEKHHQGETPKLNLADYQTQILANLEKTFDLIKQEDISSIIKEIINKEHIEIFSVGSSTSLGIEFSKKLLHLGIKNQMCLDWDDLYVKSKQLTQKEFAIFISQSGETIQLLEYANNLKANEVTFLTITGNAESPLAKLSDYTLTGKTEPYYFGEVDLSSRISLASILDLLAIEIAHSK